MPPHRIEAARTAIRLCLIGLAGAAVWLSGSFFSEPRTALGSLAARLSDCFEEGSDADAECTGLVYVWSPVMPLSRSGISEAEDAAHELGLRLDILEASQLYGAIDEAVQLSRKPAAAEGFFTDIGTGGAAGQLARAFAAAGATVHFPSLIVYRQGAFAGKAILGYKRAAAYASLVRNRLASQGAVTDERSRTEGPVAAEHVRAGIVVKEIEIEGRAGAYFRFAHGWNTIAYERRRVVHLLNLASGESDVGPGFIDFVPSPDGTFFVTPAPGHNGLEFYDAATVFSQARKGFGADVKPLFTDPDMRDQYPSIGLLQESVRDTRMALYRVLTSWFENVVKC